MTLDADVERLLREAMQRTRASFKQTLNAAIRAGLGQKPTPARRRGIVLKVRPLGLRSGLDPSGFNRLVEVGGRLGVRGLATAAAPIGGAVIIPDLYLLLYACDSGSPFHAKARTWWCSCLQGTEPVGLPHVVLFGFVRLATSARVFQHPMTPVGAAEHIRAWLEQPPVQILDAGPQHVRQVLASLEETGAAGNRVTDAQLAALALDHDAVLHTADAGFSRFAGLRWFHPLTAGASAGPRRSPRRPA